jgi:putative phosphoesterase
MADARFRTTQRAEKPRAATLRPRKVLNGGHPRPSGPLEVLVLADTHIRRDRARTLPAEVWAAADDADVILHAGDVLTHDLLDELGRRAPVHAVLGNNDADLRDELPETLELELAGVRVAMIHDSGTRTGRPGRLRRRFPDADLVIYGHSHLPEDDEGVDGQRLFNPGSCTERRRAPARTYGLLHLEGGRILGHRIVALPPAH